MTAEPHYDLETADLSQILDRVRAGEEVVIDESGEPMAKVIPMRRKPIRTPGLLKGKIWMAEDWDSDEVNEEIARDFGMLP